MSSRTATTAAVAAGTPHPTRAGDDKSAAAAGDAPVLAASSAAQTGTDTAAEAD